MISHDEKTLEATPMLFDICLTQTETLGYPVRKIGQYVTFAKLYDNDTVFYKPLNNVLPQNQLFDPLAPFSNSPDKIFRNFDL